MYWLFSFSLFIPFGNSNQLSNEYGCFLCLGEVVKETPIQYEAPLLAMNSMLIDTVL